MLKWIGKRIVEGAIRKAPRQLIEGFIDVVKAPPEALLEAWDGIEAEDQQRIIDVLRTTADLYIKYGSKV